ncbi:MAG: exodeoxyribonuclease VII small subunit [Gammaproteobacteria bacterium PRO9]|nr:exodeoxyribonuclease VII small subunit [Gammaproteobacteria bacterium PRO9]
MNTPRRKPAAQPVDLEKALADLEAIVEQLESGDLSLDKSLKEFERGVRLSRECQGALKAAEQRVQALMGGELKEFPAGDEDAGDQDDDGALDDAPDADGDGTPF